MHNTQQPPQHTTVQRRIGTARLMKHVKPASTPWTSGFFTQCLMNGIGVREGVCGLWLCITLTCAPPFPPFA